ncbi:GntR family transcriptional regulator [Mesorhizobium sp. B2-4-6]|uniref:GntR family transcriptional regulator n=1 Tax=Mesorhizobium sp. B2-4-6 TaxID=2589943 RepID=UPI0015E381B4|nr:GntR family transcriptional regulator [Mesorhizobium sp. B2-4-6]
MKETLQREMVHLRRMQPLNAATEVASELRKAIISGSLVAGTRLIESDIAAQMAVSRGPVREALRIPHEDEMPNRGAIVSAVSADDVLEVYAIRGSLGLIAIRNLIGQYHFSEDGKAIVQIRIDGIRTGEFAKLRSLSGAKSSEIIEQEFRIQSATMLAASLPRVYRRFDRLTVEIQSLVSRIKIEHDAFDTTVEKYANLPNSLYEEDGVSSERVWRKHIQVSSTELLEKLPGGDDAIRVRPWMDTLY